MKAINITILALMITLGLNAQKDQFELFETDAAHVAEKYDKLKLQKKYFKKVVQYDAKDSVSIYLSNNQVLLDSYFSEGEIFKGGVAIYESDFVIRIDYKLKIDEEFGEVFKDFYPGDDRVKVKLFYKNEANELTQVEVKIMDGFIRTKRKDMGSAKMKTALLLSGFYSINGSFNLDFEKEVDVTELVSMN